MTCEKAKPPTISGLPLIGNVLDFRRDLLGLQARTSALAELAAFRMGPIRINVSSSSAVMHAVLTEHPDAFKKSRGIGRLATPLLGQGLLTSEGELHRRQRKLLGPAFTPKRLGGYGESMVACTESRLAGWKDGEVRDIAGDMMALTLDIVSRTLFDADTRHEARPIGEALTAAMEYIMWALSSPLSMLPRSWPLPQNVVLRKAIARLDETIFRIIRERRARPVDRGDVLSILLAARDEEDGTGMSDRQVRDESMTLFLAGHETTANALAWTWFLLSQHPSAYEKLLAEIDVVLEGRRVTVEDLPRLPFAAQVIKEAMRLYPPAYLLGREALRDVEIAGWGLPKGSTILLDIFSMHRRADYFPDPERFMPERFADEKRLPKGTYLPFGSGPRVCIGNHFALMEATLVLATIARHFRFELARDPHVVPEPLITLRPKGGLRMSLRRRSALHGPIQDRSPRSIESRPHSQEIEL